MVRRGGVTGGLLALVVGGVAFAGAGSTEQRYDQSLTEERVNRSSGTSLAISSTDPENPQNQQPKRITNFDITFPRGVRIDLRAARRCDATRAEFAAAENPDDACPAGARIGGGTVTMRSPTPGTPDLVGIAGTYNSGTGVLTFADFNDGNGSLLLKHELKRTTFRTRVPAMRSRDAQPLAMSGLELEIAARTTRRRGKRHRLFATPRECPSGGWVFRSRFTYADGTLLDFTDRSPCRR